MTEVEHCMCKIAHEVKHETAPVDSLFIQFGVSQYIELSCIVTANNEMHGCCMAGDHVSFLLSH